MDMNNKDSNNVEVLDGVSNTPATSTPVETLDLGGVSSTPVSAPSPAPQVETLMPEQPVVSTPTLDPNVVPVTPVVEPTPVPVTPVMPTVQPTPMPADPTPVVEATPVAPVQPVAPTLEATPIVEPVQPTPVVETPVVSNVDPGLNLMEDFPQTEESAVSVEPVVQETVQPEVEAVTTPVEPVQPEVSAPVASSPVAPVEPVDVVEPEVSLTPFANDQSTGINSDPTVTPDIDVEVSLTQASEQQKVKKSGLNDTVVFIGILVVVIAVAIFVLPFLFKLF